MALTIEEQLVFINEPNDTWEYPGAYSLKEVLYQKSVNWYTEFQQTYKAGAEDLAYYRKITETMTRLINRRISISKLVAVLLSELADTAVTYAQVLGATAPQWENFIDDQMDMIVFIISRVTKADIAEYNGL